MSRLLVFLTICLLILTGCSTVSGNIAKDALASAGSGAGAIGGTVQQGLLDATSNLDQAVAVGALKPDDPAAACLHGVLQQLGIDPSVPAPPAASFTPKVSDLISLGSVLYIRAQQLQALQAGGISAPAGCKALIGQFVMDAAAAGLKLQPVGGLLVPIR